MKYLLDKDWRLRGWYDRLACLEYFPTRELRSVTPQEFGLLKRCDGTAEVDAGVYGEQAAEFERRGILHPVDETGRPRALDPAQRYLYYENRCIRNVTLSITGRCDFRCRHCFNAADDTRARGTQPRTEDLLELVGRLDDCGVCGVTITGGEPLMNPDLLAVTGELARCNMAVNRLETNLFHMTPQTLDALLAQGHRPVIYTSFDGVGHHEWLRRMAGSERRCIEGIRLAKSRGLPVTAHVCVWKDSLPALRDTVLTLQGTGVDGVRITTVEPSQRWVRTSSEQTIGIRAWLDYLEGFLAWWYESGVDMDLDLWSFWRDERDGRPCVTPSVHEFVALEDRMPACPDAYRTPYIDCDGRIMLCMAFSGISKELGLAWGNVYEDDMHELLREGPFMKQCLCTVGQMKRANEECRSCAWAQHCRYGCRAEAFAQGNGISGVDRRMCVFFQEGYYERFDRLAEGVRRS